MAESVTIEDRNLAKAADRLFFRIKAGTWNNGRLYDEDDPQGIDLDGLTDKAARGRGHEVFRKHLLFAIHQTSRLRFADIETVGATLSRWPLLIALERMGFNLENGVEPKPFEPMSAKELREFACPMWTRFTKPLAKFFAGINTFSSTTG
jgi:hypothetical protein